MTAECGKPHDHDPHLDQIEGVIIKCDGDSTKRKNYDGTAANKPSQT